MKNSIDFLKLKRLMQQIAITAQDVIVECEKNEPEHVLICDLAIERMDELRDEVEATVFRRHRMVYEPYASSGVQLL